MLEKAISTFSFSVTLTFDL